MKLVEGVHFLRVGSPSCPPSRSRSSANSFHAAAASARVWSSRSRASPVPFFLVAVAMMPLLPPRDDSCGDRSAREKGYVAPLVTFSRMATRKTRELAQVIAEEVAAQWNRVEAVMERADPGFVESLPDLHWKPTGVGSAVMFRFDLEDDVLILCEASRRRVIRATIEARPRSRSKSSISPVAASTPTRSPARTSIRR